MQVPAERAEEVAGLVGGCLAEAVRAVGAGRARVRFIADITIVGSWADAKG